MNILRKIKNINVLIASALKSNNVTFSVGASINNPDNITLSTANDGIYSEKEGYSDTQEALNDINLLSKMNTTFLMETINAFYDLKPALKTFKISKDNLRPKDLDYVTEMFSLDEKKSLAFVTLNKTSFETHLLSLDPLDNISLLIALSKAIDNGCNQLEIHNVEHSVFNCELADFSNPEVNENCLHQIQCPFCASTSRFEFETTAFVDWTDQGTDDSLTEPSFNPGSQCECLSCNYSEQTKAFFRNGKREF